MTQEHKINLFQLNVEVGEMKEMKEKNQKEEKWPVQRKRTEHIVYINHMRVISRNVDPESTDIDCVE